MSISIHDASVLQSFEEVVPRAAAHAESYLRAVAQGVQEYEPPVSMAIDTLHSGGFRAQQIQCLVVEPTEPRLRPFKTAHYAVPSGGSLRVGWHLVGRERAGGRQIGILSFGAPSDLEVDEVMSIVQIVHTYAVVPAIQQLADSVQYGNQQSGGFFGV
ncbi:hypothetical protein [Blastococcus sp. TF02-09]|uniref:hypothetical protein n=1 Tax=Blastococcus sp. TF02-09 TaxID=2250576 RepID=UPI000DE96E12|nr:hypothetical protein [Blastococcus sp. TF02-9]